MRRVKLNPLHRCGIMTNWLKFVVLGRELSINFSLGLAESFSVFSKVGFVSLSGLGGSAPILQSRTSFDVKWQC